MDKLSTKPAILKVTTVVVGLAAMAFTMTAYGKGAYYHSTCNKAIYNEGSMRHHHQSLSPRQYPSNSSRGGSTSTFLQQFTCEGATPNTQDNCQAMNNLHNDHEATSISAQFDNRIKLKPCPSKLLVIPPIFIILAIWTISLIMLLIWLVGDTKKSAWFPKMDMIGHWIAGALMLIMGGILMVFLVTVLGSDYPCENEGYQDYQSYMTQKEKGQDPGYGQAYHFHGGFIRLKKYFEFYFSMGILKRRRYKTCGDHTTIVYQHWFLLLGTLCTGVAGILYIVTGVVLKKQEVKPVTTGGMVGQGEGQQISQQPSQVTYQQQEQNSPGPAEPQQLPPPMEAQQ